jgi:pimeloyl-ACP methyl ester carboxylesterase
MVDVLGQHRPQLPASQDQHPVQHLTPTPRLAELAALFPRGQLVVQPGAGHFPWLDDPAWFVGQSPRFLGA